jgi:hypothetical protein
MCRFLRPGKIWHIHANLTFKGSAIHRSVPRHFQTESLIRMSVRACAFVCVVCRIAAAAAVVVNVRVCVCVRAFVNRHFGTITAVLRLHNGLAESDLACWEYGWRQR